MFLVAKICVVLSAIRSQSKNTLPYKILLKISVEKHFPFLSHIIDLCSVQ